MAGNPRTVAVDVTFLWDGVTQRLPRGQAIDVTPGSPLERAIGRDNLVPRSADPVPAPAEKPAPQEEAAPAKTGATAKSDDGKDGEP